eukprot:6415189-Ditylum_brightwellii.AAC.1
MGRPLKGELKKLERRSLQPPYTLSCGRYQIASSPLGVLSALLPSFNPGDSIECIDGQCQKERVQE